ncbi:MULTISPECIES: HalOD1 output domain-containing protein [Haloarcula]|uniref:HalOD1 output domain-containing protein n=1 Tax=Haloarcula TaxID=2237 RepID=UPI0023ECAE6B|nr:HalOD1 output domain-containing protein [Halomicroarcula sp. XH51]
MDDSDSDDDAGPQERIIERQVDPVPGEANVRLLETIADVEGVDATDLPRLYPWLDEILKNLFSDPPADEAQTEVTFSYYGYRFTVTQDGRITMRKLGSLPDDVA